MKNHICSLFRLAVLVSVSPVSSASAVVSIDYVSVGNADNLADTADGDSNTPGVQRYGAVAYEYKIAKNETTIGQYAEFLNAKAKSDPYVLYHSSMTTSFINGISRSGVDGSYIYKVNPGSANKPITWVSWFDAARFCNWLHNGQGSGSTETGAYTLNGAMSGVYLKNTNATVWIPSENEWYKAAYYDPTKGGTGGYWRYPTQRNTMTNNDIGVAGAANFKDEYGGYATYTGYTGDTWGITDVGAFGVNSDSFYGTNDQGGNVHEWNDAVGSGRGTRGGRWDTGYSLLGSFMRGDHGDPSYHIYFIGFRVASVSQPNSPSIDFRITSFLFLPQNSQIQLTWNSEQAARYSIQSCTNLALTTWTTVVTGVASQGSSTSYVIPKGQDSWCFYRVLKQP